MKIELKTEKPKYDNLINNFIFILFGIFASSVIAALFIKLLPNFGAYLSIITLAALIYCGFKYIEKGTKTRMITWGIVTTLTMVILFSTIAMIMISTNLNFQ